MELQDERIKKAIALFQEAWTLLDNLKEVRQRLPLPEMPPAGKLPADWNAERSYALCVHKLESHLYAAVRMVIMDLDIRNEFQIRESLLPPSAKFGLTGSAWLEERDRHMGEDPQAP